MTDNFLAELSKQAYTDDISVVGYRTLSIWDRGTDTTCFVVSNDQEQIVVFRGTAITLTNFKDLQTNLKVKQKGGIHEGFLAAYNSVAKALHVALDFSNKTTVFTGHSLGGALAIIAHTDFMLPSSRCCVFGAPRVFEKYTAKTYHRIEGKRIVRYESPADPVPYLPPYSMGYRHIGTLVGGTSFVDFLTTTIKTKLKSHGIDNYIDTINNLKTEELQ